MRILAPVAASHEAFAATRVLEIGTGTGYHAALLAARLGDDRVTSMADRPRP